MKRYLERFMELLGVRTETLAASRHAGPTAPTTSGDTMSPDEWHAHKEKMREILRRAQETLRQSRQFAPRETR